MCVDGVADASIHRLTLHNNSHPCHACEPQHAGAHDCGSQTLGMNQQVVNHSCAAHTHNLCRYVQAGSLRQNL